MSEKWNLELETMPGFERSMERIYAWYEGEILDRPPVIFHYGYGINPLPSLIADSSTLKDAWFNLERRVDDFAEGMKGKVVVGDSFPVFFPNLGPEIYSAYFGAELGYGEHTAWSIPPIEEMEQVPESIRFDPDNFYFRKTLEFMELALERCKGQFMVGYTDLHPGIDFVAGLRDPQGLCMDLLTDPEPVKRLLNLSSAHFAEIFDRFDELLKAHRQLSVSWMDIPSFETMHIPSADFATMLSPEHFNQFCLPCIQHEVRHCRHNVFHLDGRGVARHLDALLELPEIQAIQWVQGVGEDEPIAKWYDLIRKIQDHGKSVVVNAKPKELAGLFDAVKPEGILLTSYIQDERVQKEMLSNVERWVH